MKTASCIGIDGSVRIISDGVNTRMFWSGCGGVRAAYIIDDVELCGDGVDDSVLHMVLVIVGDGEAEIGDMVELDIGLRRSSGKITFDVTADCGTITTAVVELGDGAIRFVDCGWAMVVDTYMGRTFFRIGSTLLP